MWELYEELIAGIPEGLHIKRSVAGSFWTVVESELGVGAAGTAKTMTRPPLQRAPLAGMPLKEAAELAIARANGVLFDQGDDRLNDPYIAYRKFARDKKVACIGSHSTMVDSMLKDVAEVSMLGENMGEFPLQAADYLLPQQDLVYLPCYAEITKELPRYLALCKNAVAVICGPSVSMSPILFAYGAFDMAGLVVTDADMAFESACGTAVKKMFAAGKKASLRREVVQNLR